MTTRQDTSMEKATPSALSSLVHQQTAPPAISERTTQIFIGNLAKTVRKSDIMAFLRQYYPTNVLIHKKLEGDTRPNYATVYVPENLCDQLIHEMNCEEILDRPCNIRIYRKPNRLDSQNPSTDMSKIVAKNLPRDATARQVYITFRQFGDTPKITLPTKEDGTNFGYAKIAYQSVRHAQDAFRVVNDLHKCGKSDITVEKYVRKPKEETFTGVYVYGLPADIKECTLRDQLGSLEESITSLYLSNPSKEHQKTSIAVIEAKDNKSAQEIIRIINASDNLNKSRAVRRLTRGELKIQRIKEQQKVYNQFRDRNLLVQNVPKDYDDEKLRSLFEKFGTVIKLRINRYPNRASKRSAYVCMSTLQEVKTVIDKLDEIVPNDAEEGDKLQIFPIKPKYLRFMHTARPAFTARPILSETIQIKSGQQVTTITDATNMPKEISTQIQNVPYQRDPPLIAPTESTEFKPTTQPTLQNILGGDFNIISEAKQKEKLIQNFPEIDKLLNLQFAREKWSAFISSNEISSILDYLCHPDNLQKEFEKLAM